MIVSVLGATGYVGGFVIKHLEKYAPHIRLRVTGRNRTKLDRLAQRPSVDTVHSYAHGDRLEEILRGSNACIDLTYNIQGIPSEVIIAARNHARTLVQTACDLGLARVVVTGSIGVYGEPVIRHPWRSPPTPNKLHPNTMYGKSKTIVEKVAAKTAKRTGIPLALVRAGHVFGPGSAMASGIAGRLIHCTPSLLDESSAPSNATSVEGLARTLSELAIDGFGKASITCNHVDLEGVTYDALVTHIANSIRIHPVAGNAPPAKTGGSNRLRQILQANKKNILIMQSSLGLFDLGISANIIRRLKHRLGGEADSVGSSAMDQSTAKLHPLYASDPVPHSSAYCGHAVAPGELGSALAGVDNWLACTGFRPN